MEGEGGRGREGYDVIAAAVRGGRARARQSQHGARGESAEVARVERRVRGDDDDDGAVGAVGVKRRLDAPLVRPLLRRGFEVFLEVVAAQLTPDRRAVHREHAAEVRLNKHAAGVAAVLRGPAARGRADAAFEAEGHGARARADRTLLDLSALRRLQSREDFLGTDVATAYVVQLPVVRLGDDGVYGAHLLVSGKREHPFDQSVGDARDVQGVCEQDRRLDLAEFVDLRRTHELAEAVADEDGGGDFLAEEVAAVRKYRRHARANVRALNQCRVSDAHALHVCDGVESARGQHADHEADVARAWSFRFAAVLCHQRQEQGERERVLDDRRRHLRVCDGTRRRAPEVFRAALYEKARRL